MDALRALEIKKREYGISSSAIKIIAMVTMFIDHAAIMLIKNAKLYGYDEALYQNAIALPEARSWLVFYRICRMIGRIAFPLFALLIVEGFRKSSNVFKYFVRILILAFISEIPFNLMIFNKLFCLDLQNVLFTYLIALIMLTLIKLVGQTQIFLHAIFLIVSCTICYFLKTDYWLEGILLIFSLYEFRHDLNVKCLVALVITLLLSIEKFYGAAALSVIFIYFYDERKGYLDVQKFSYIFFPLHMIVLYGIVYFSYLQ